MTALLELRAVSPRRGGRELGEPVSIAVAAGTALGVLGPNGAGKSSLLAAIARTGVAFTGAVRIAGRDLAREGARRRARLVAMLAQDAAAPPELRVRELVEIGARASGAVRTARAVASALERLDLAGLADRSLGTLSGGQRQLAQLARVVAQDAPVVLLDEPTTALDPGHRLAVASAIRDLAAAGRVVVAATHDLDLALDALPRALLLTGRGGYDAGPSELVLSPSAVESVFGVRTTRHRAEDGRLHLLPLAVSPRPGARPLLESRS